MEQNARPWRYLKITVFGFFLLLFGVASSLYGGSAREFPGPKTELRSPHGLYLIKNVDTPSEPFHALLLKDTKTGAVRTLCNYERSVTVLWSPDGKKLALNDSTGNNSSESLIFLVDQNRPPINVGAALLQSLKDSPEGKSLVQNHDVFFAVSRWQGNNAVKLKVWGHGQADPKGFTRLYVYNLGGGFRPLRRRHF